MAANAWQTVSPGGVSSVVVIGQGPGSSLGAYNVSVKGIFTGEVILERRFSGDTDWLKVGSFNAAIETAGVEAEAATEYRFNCQGVTGGDVTVRLGQ